MKYNKVLNKSGEIYISDDLIVSEDTHIKNVHTSSKEHTAKTGKELGKSLNSKTGSHSFLFWLVAPLIVLWMTASYFVGIIREHPSWSKTGYASFVSQTDVNPYSKYFVSAVNTNNGFVTFWFDDAWLSQYMNAYPILKRYSFPAAIAVPTSAVETKDYVNWAQLRVLQNNGWEITNHSDTHDCKMQNWSKNIIENEIKTSSNILWKNQLTSDIFVTPCGVDGTDLRSISKEHFIGYRTVDPGFNSIDNLDFYKLKVRNTDSYTSMDQIKKWIDEAKSKNLWLILVLHKVGEAKDSNEIENYNISNNNLNEIASYVKDLGIQVVVPSQMLNFSK